MLLPAIGRKKVLVKTVLTIVVCCLALTSNAQGRGAKTLVIQGNIPNCGAYATAYYKWLKEGKTKSDDTAADRAYVDKLYDEIILGEQYGDWGPASNPAKIMKFCKENVDDGTWGVGYLNTDDKMIKSIWEAMQAFDAPLLAEIPADHIKNRRPTAADLSNGKYAIVVCTTHTESLHYVLFHNTGSELVVYDPHVGKAQKSNADEFEGRKTFRPRGFVLRSTGIAIVLP